MEGNQVEFPISSSDGGSSAVFDGGGWALKNNASYSAYYPFSVWNYHKNNKRIQLDYSGQVQEGNGTFGHLSDYDFLASSMTAPVNSRVTFQMNRVGSILYIDIIVPTPSTLDSLVISCADPIFTEIAELDISGTDPAVNPIRMTDKLTLCFSNVTTTVANETVRAYMAVCPVDFSDKTVTATLHTTKGPYKATVESREVKQGKAAFLRFTEEFTPSVISFADPVVKQLCVENWDSDGDGELSFYEAAMVTDLGKAFAWKGKDKITSFNELQYFTGLTRLGNQCFYYEDLLNSIIIPEGITSIGRGCFDYCMSLSSISIPESVTLIEDGAFWGCSSLTSIIIPDSVVEIGERCFVGCNSLSSFSGKYSSPDGRLLIKDNKLLAIASYGLASIDIPEGVTSLGQSCFSNNNNLTSVTIPGSVSEIGEGCFSSSKLTEIIIPEGVTALPNSCFNCCYDLSSVTLPQSLTVIGEQCFTRCGMLESIVIPSNVSEIGYGAFFLCDNLTSVTLLSGSVISFFKNSNQYAIGIPEGEYGVFLDTNDCPIYVHNDLLAAYQGSSYWAPYVTRIQGIDINGDVVGPDDEIPD